jgi:hypothetical protein
MKSVSTFLALGVFFTLSLSEAHAGNRRVLSCWGYPEDGKRHYISIEIDEYQRPPENGSMTTDGTVFFRVPTNNDSYEAEAQITITTKNGFLSQVSAYAVQTKYSAIMQMTVEFSKDQSSSKAQIDAKWDSSTAFQKWLEIKKCTAEFLIK